LRNSRALLCVVLSASVAAAAQNVATSPQSSDLARLEPKPNVTASAHSVSAPAKDAADLLVQRIQQIAARPVFKHSTFGIEVYDQTARKTLVAIHENQLFTAGSTTKLVTEGTALAIVAMQPWSQFVNLQGATPPQSVVRKLNFIGIKGSYTAFGTIRPNPGQTDISEILFKDLDVVLKRDKLAATGVKDLKFENAIVNGQPQSA